MWGLNYEKYFNLHISPDLHCSIIILGIIYQLYCASIVVCIPGRTCQLNKDLTQHNRMVLLEQISICHRCTAYEYSWISSYFYKKRFFDMLSNIGEYGIDFEIGFLTIAVCMHFMNQHTNKSNYTMKTAATFLLYSLSTYSCTHVSIHTHTYMRTHKQICLAFLRIASTKFASTNFPFMKNITRKLV